APTVEVTRNSHPAVPRPLRDLPDTATRGTSHPALRGPRTAGAAVRAKDTSGHHRLPGIPSPTANFDGISASGFAPPDTVGAAGTTQYFEMVNVRMAVYDKAGSILYGPVNSNTLWSGFGGGCQTNNDG